jgi:hypothetical protein
MKVEGEGRYEVYGLYFIDPIRAKRQIKGQSNRCAGFSRRQE